MKTKQQIIDSILYKEDNTAIGLKRILEEELPDFNPMKIDEEIFLEIWNRGFGFPLKTVLKEYNSALPSPLVPLPKEMPKGLAKYAMGHDVYEVWDKIVSEYGTPEKQPLPSINKEAKFTFFNNEEGDYSIVYDSNGDNEKVVGFTKNKSIAENSVKALNDVLFIERNSKPELPSVEELAKEIEDKFRSVPSGDDYSVFIAQHLHSKYPLHPKQDEWWMKLKKGDSFMCKGVGHVLYFSRIMVRSIGGEFFPLEDCTPYTPPTAQDKLIAKGFTEQEAQELMKQIRETTI